MRNKFFIQIALFGWIILYACNNSQSDSLTINNHVQISVPTNLKLTQNLNEQASLQLCDSGQQLYFILLEEPKEAFNRYDLELDLNTYFSNAEQAFLADVEQPMRLNRVQTKQAIQTNYEVNSSEGKLFYCMRIIEGKEHYYQLIAWSPVDAKPKLESTLKTIFGSFREI